MVVTGTIYKILVVRYNNDRNFQFQRSYDNALIIRTFMFNFLNFYLPFFLVALAEQSFKEVFKLMFVQMLFKQIGLNIVEFYKPRLLVGKRCARIEDIFSDLKHGDQEIDEV